MSEEVITRFDQMDISTEVLKAIEKMGFTEPSTIQAKTIPLMMTSALAGALAALSGRREGLAEKLGLAVALGGAVSNTWDRMVRGYVVDYFSIRWKGLKKVVFNLGDFFIFLGALMILAGQMVREFREK